MPNLVTGAAEFDSSYMSEAVFNNLKVTSKTDVPFFSNHMKKVSEADAIVKIADRSAPASTVTLGAGYTAGTGVMTLSVHTLFNDYRVNLIPGYSEIHTPLSAAIYRVTDFDPVTRIVKIERLFGTDSTLPNGTTLQLKRHNDRGSLPNPNNDVTYGGGDYNYWSYFNYTFKITDDLMNGKFKTDINEYSLDYHLKMTMPDMYKNFSTKALFDPRVAGTGAGARIPDGTNQGGTGQRSGGVVTLGRARGLLESNVAGLPLSINLLMGIDEQLEDRQAWSTADSIQTAIGLRHATVYIDPLFINEPSRLAVLSGSDEALLDVGQKIDGMLGIYSRKVLAGQTVYSFIREDAFKGTGAMFIETNIDDIEIDVLHFQNLTELAKPGAYTHWMAENAFATKFSCPWRHALVSGLSKLG